MSSAAAALPDRNAGVPPIKNTVMTAYDNFVRDTPAVCRCMMESYVIFIFTGRFFDPVFALSNIPYYTIRKFELYRMFLSPCYSSHILSMIFAYFNIKDHLFRLEFAMGSTQFAWLLLTMVLLGNSIQVALSFFMSAWSGDTNWEHVTGGGIWLILLPLIAVDCLKSPPTVMRRFVILTIPPVYYPLFVSFIFCFFVGYAFTPYLCAVGAGYLYGFGYVNFLKVSHAQAQHWEETRLANFAKKQGWVLAPDALGSDAWSDLGSANYTPGLGVYKTAAATVGTVGKETKSLLLGKGDEEGEFFPAGSGRPLGGPTATRRAANADTRAARLKVLEGSNSTNRKGEDEKV